MESNLEKALEEIQLPVRNIFTEHEFANFWVVWSAHKWQKYGLAPMFSHWVLTRQHNLLKWSFPSLPQLCVICCFFFYTCFFLFSWCMVRLDVFKHRRRQCKTPSYMVAWYYHFPDFLNVSELWRVWTFKLPCQWVPEEKASGRNGCLPHCGLN